MRHFSDLKQYYFPIKLNIFYVASISPPTSLKIDVGEPLLAYKNNNICDELAVAIEDIKFAQITEAAGDIFIDDETSPIDSLMSSCDSDEIITKKNKKKINDSIKGIIDESLPLLDFSCPLSPGSPTHASNSLSLSDGDVGRDFLIDDEIADQPALCFSDKHGNWLELFSRSVKLIFYLCPQKLKHQILNYFLSQILQHSQILMHH